MNSSDPRHFFESDAQQSQRERREAKSSNRFGKPIVLKSKIAAACVNPLSPSTSIFIAESAGSVRRVDIDDHDSKPVIYRGPSAPITCVAVGGSQDRIVFAGSWDRNVWSWDIETRQPGRKFVGHSDFVKAVTCTKIGGKDVLVSGGADKKIMVWDIDTGSRLHVLQDSVTAMLAVQSLAVDPILSSGDEAVIISAGSDPVVRRWKVRLDGWEQLVDAEPGTPNVERRSIKVHETGVYKVLFDHSGEEADLWTASADGSAKCLSRGKAFTAEDSFEHGDHVRAVAVTDQWVITAGRDEDVKIWDRASGKLYCSLQGHYDEVTDLVLLDGGHGQETRLASVSIDGTVRSWPLDKVGIDTAVQEQQKTAINGAGDDQGKEEPEKLLTAEEEAELAELLDED
ncbi:wd repeat-containing protein [Diaporthe amygdali]|uniref:wd repeat-containing protein n=1 Tax=Phomopsis amygdali TaxID=1214568 RepID=UPI0022FE4788|nr:wd repeat-containing protein [Diaporthe amygdali]KAJ0125473.1 wd repeat-containing protein [Diaporthe amygdali]